jgi:cell wall-associated NlpC family hydrolase
MTLKFRNVLFFLLLSCCTSSVVYSQTEPSDSVGQKVSPKVDALISYAKTFLGVPYRYGGSTPSGFDCSGFINYIFGNFGFSLVRSSYQLAEFGETIPLSKVQPGDLMFFKGSNVNSSTVGHVGMIIEVKEDALNFIHSANGGVQITNFKTSKYYIARYVKTKRLDYGGK